MKKKLLSAFFAVCMIFGLFASTVPVLAADPVTATPDSSAVTIDGDVSVMFPVYKIGGDKYFKLRDLAYMLSSTKKHFEVEWDGANNAIILTSGKSYTIVGGEMTPKSGVYQSAAPASSKLCRDGEEIPFTAYHIEGNHYFQLRDIGKVFHFEVEWDEEKHTFLIDTNKEYTSDPQEQLLSYLSELFTIAYEPYYDGLHYTISNYQDTILDGEYTATFLWTMHHLDNGLDAANDKGKETQANFFLQATTEITNESLLDLDIIQILADASVTDAPDYSTPIQAFFPSVENGAIPKQ